MKFANREKLGLDTNNIMKQMFLRGFAPRNPLVGLASQDAAVPPVARALNYPLPFI